LTNKNGRETPAVRAWARPLLLGGFLGFVGYRLCGIGSVLGSFGGGIGSHITGSGGSFTCSLDGLTRGFGGSVCSFGRCAGCFLGFLHGGGGSFFRFLASAHCKRGEKCN
jgi:hypothetical protein